MSEAGFFCRVEKRSIIFLNKYSVDILRISLGIIFILFGAVKFWNGLSPAEGLAIRTLNVLTFNCIKGIIAIKILAAWECLIGAGLLYNKYIRVTLILLFIHLLGTFLPLLFFPKEIWTSPPLVFTILGQYIVKNLVLISAAMVLAASRKTVVIKKTEYGETRI
ncbi:MAG: hypothetical protein WDM71_05625 [Ferruginibacter sp.]